MKRNLKKGDKVVMHTCYESEKQNYEGKIWTCDSDEFQQCDHKSVFLEGFTGSFNVEYLQYIDLD